MYIAKQGDHVLRDDNNKHKQIQTVNHGPRVRRPAAAASVEVRPIVVTVQVLNSDNDTAAGPR